MGWFGPSGDCGCCGGCFCGTSKLYLTLHDVTMNLSPITCLTPHTGTTIDETWFNGVTFYFELDWTSAEFIANNPNEYDDPDTHIECVQQGGVWNCVYIAGTPSTEFFWSLKVFTSTSSGSLLVTIILFCDEKVGPTSTGLTSRGEVIYKYATTCPEGTPTEEFRGTSANGFAFTFGHYEFKNFTADLVWA